MPVHKARLVVLTTAIVTAVGTLALHAGAQELRLIKFNAFSPRREVMLASELGFFARHGIQVDQSFTQSSEREAQELLDGTWDITGVDADNYVYWTHDRDADFFIFMVTEGTIDNHLWVTEEIQSFDDLRGKVLAVDSAFSGQSTMLRMMLQDHGLEVDRDVTFLPVGSDRLPSLLDGRAVGASIGGSTANSDVAREGRVHILARGPDYLPTYPANPYGTTRRWAVAHPDLLLGFVGTLIDAKAWLLDASHQQAAVEAIMRTDGVDVDRAAVLYRQAVTAAGDISTATQVREDMIQLVEDMRASVGLMEKPTPPPSKFVTPAWYDLALTLRATATGR